MRKMEHFKSRQLAFMHTFRAVSVLSLLWFYFCNVGTRLEDRLVGLHGSGAGWSSLACGIWAYR